QYSRVLAGMLRATLDVHDGAIDAAIAHFRDAVALAEQTHVSFIAAVARRRLGLLVGGSEGQDLVIAPEQWMRDDGIQSVEQMPRLMRPRALRISALLVRRMLPDTPLPAS